MNWTRFSTKIYKTCAADSKSGSSFCHTRKPRHNATDNIESIPVRCGFQSQRGNLPATSWPRDGCCVATVAKDFQDSEQRLMGSRNVISRFNGSSVWSKQSLVSLSRQFGHKAGSGGDPELTRDFFIELWVADRIMEQTKRNGRGKAVKYSKQTPYHYSSYGWYSSAPFSQAASFDEGEPDMKQPPPSQSVSGYLKPESPEEAQVMPLLARSNLLITREIEWVNLTLGFEQENRYAIVDVCYPESPVGFIREKSQFIGRQLLRLRRPFVACVTDAMGNELFREIGVVHRRWHLWRRVYDLYLGNKQFAVVENPGFWHWTFTLKDIDSKVLAEIDREWRGFGFEINELEVIRPLTLLERAVTVALAVSLDNDYFSRHGGCTIGEMLAKEINSSFIDADDFHPQSNKEKMRNGIPLTEEDRIPWLETLRNSVRDKLVAGGTVILGCSALQKRYREILRSADPNYKPGSCASLVKFVLLDAQAEVLAARLEKRIAEGKHFMSPALLQSQLGLLQIDDSEGILKVDAILSPQEIVNTIQRLLFDLGVQNCNH
ncbi:hypothetical protein C1H46_028545 [Malus baccata]|uniref:gluconokinase n=1 Tax=Malus baccata TaxID=106549 RepID=A0A540LH94_MALBA|nr:hypothetical protein C1H46_028545 [Malus baccata]